MQVSKLDIINGLDNLGLTRGNKVLVHSSLSSFGHVRGGADTVIDAVLETVGDSGTVLVPTLTGDESLSVANPPFFDPAYSKSRTGIIPETFRLRTAATRSLHPTHSVAAMGRDVSLLIDGHSWSVTPCDELSPYGKLAEYDDSYILLIGVTHQSSTMFHHVEEIAGVDYHMQPGFVKATIIVNNISISRSIMLHQYGTPRNFDVMEPIFEEQGIQRKGRIGNSIVRLIRINKMVQASLYALRVDKRILCAS